MDSFLFAIATPDLNKPVYTLSVYEDFDNDNVPETVTAALSGNFCQLTAQFKDHKQTIPILMPEAATSDIDIVARDVNNNSYKDLVIVNKRTHRLLSVILNNCDGTFKLSSSCYISYDNFRPEIVRKNRRGSDKDKFSNNELFVKFVADTAVCVLTKIDNNLNLRSIDFDIQGKKNIFTGNFFKAFLPRSPPASNNQA
jgi:hypothetical protein